FLTLAPSVALTIAAALTIVPRLSLVAGLLLALILVAQPARLAEARKMYRMNEYELYVRGSRDILRHAREVREVDTAFAAGHHYAVDAPADRAFIYRVLGGRISPTASLIATIGPDGHAKFRAATSSNPSP